MTVKSSGSNVNELIAVTIAGPEAIPEADMQMPTLELINAGWPLMIKFDDPVTHVTIMHPPPNLGSNGHPVTKYMSDISIGKWPSIR
jgi:hypothetical protein